MLTWCLLCVKLLKIERKMSYSMKKNRTDIVFVLDRSGSMENIVKDMIGGFNSYIKKQKEVPGECFVSVYQFDNIYEKVFERVPLLNVKDLDDQTYVPRGSTALFDAFGKTIDDYGAYLSSLKEEDRPERVLLVVITDGQNNASVKFTLEDVRSKIKVQTETYNWDFVFMGSNIDAWDEGGLLGISRGSTLQFSNMTGSVAAAFASFSKQSTSYRSADIKCAYTFSNEDLKDQEQFLDEKQKSKLKTINIQNNTKVN